MTCETAELELVAYHFGTCSPDAREHVEEHLLTCQACLHAFFELKRNIEDGESELRPSEAAKERLRLAVQDQLRGPAPRWRWWERPFAFGVAGAAAAAALLAVHVVSTSPGAPPLMLRAQVQQQR